MNRRLHSDEIYARLKAATTSAIRSTPQGDCAKFAELTRVEGRSLRKFCDHASDLFAPIDIIADIEVAAAQPIVTRVLADLAGFDLTPQRPCPETSALRAVQETSEASAAIASLLINGAWDRERARAVQKEVREAMNALGALDAALSQKISGGRK